MQLTQQQKHERAKDDAKASNDFARYAAQAALFINGGAATAVLTLLANVVKNGKAPNLHVLPVALVVYATGVFVAAVALPIASKSMEVFMSHWDDGQPATLGNRLWSVTLALIVASLGLFMVASVTVAIGLSPLVAR
jgi:hypothetical protein